MPLRRITRASWIAATLAGSPGALAASPEAPCARVTVDPATLRADVEALALGFLPRTFDHPRNLDRAAAWAAGRLRDAGLAPREQAFEVEGRTYRNVIATVGPERGDRIVVGAHYDAAGDQPGADDDASGVAGVLALARLLARDPPPLRVDLVLWTLEEPPAFETGAMGSAHHARALRAEGARVRAAIALEMIGSFSDAPGSQRYPELPPGRTFPSAGNFIAVASRIEDARLVQAVAAAMASATPLPVEPLAAPAAVPGIALSDHGSYWAEGFPGVMVTDTAFYRNARYHTGADRPETLDYRRMADVVAGTHCAIASLARRAP